MVARLSGGTNAGSGVRVGGGSDGILSPPKRAASWLRALALSAYTVGGVVISFEVFFFQRRLRFGTASMTARSR
jgi:hypothetical protein